jgi:hypothetical protein
MSADQQLKRKIDDSLNYNMATIKRKSKMKTRAQRTFYVGKTAYHLEHENIDLNKLENYLGMCLGSYHLVSNFNADTTTLPYTTILQMIYNIAAYNKQLSFRHHSDDKQVFQTLSSDLRTYILKFKVLDIKMHRSECVWYTNGIFYFNAPLIRLAIETAKTNVVDVVINNGTHLKRATTDEMMELATDIAPAPSEESSAMVFMLFCIAEHALLHMFERQPADYIMHKHMPSAQYYTIFGQLRIKEDRQLNAFIKDSAMFMGCEGMF